MWLDSVGAIPQSPLGSEDGQEETAAVFGATVAKPKWPVGTIGWLRMEERRAEVVMAGEAELGLSVGDEPKPPAYNTLGLQVEFEPDVEYAC